MYSIKGIPGLQFFFTYGAPTTLIASRSAIYWVFAIYHMTKLRPMTDHQRTDQQIHQWITGDPSAWVAYTVVQPLIFFKNCTFSQYIVCKAKIMNANWTQFQFHSVSVLFDIGVPSKTTSTASTELVPRTAERGLIYHNESLNYHNFYKAGKLT